MAKANPIVTPDQVRRASGRRGRDASGKNTEAAVIGAQHDSRGPLLALDPIPNGVRIFSGGAAAVKTPYDFSGCVVGSGRGFFTDAKHVGDGRNAGHATAQYGFPWDKCTKPHQLYALALKGHAGAIAGLTVENAHGRRWLWLDWRFFDEAAELVYRGAGRIDWSFHRWCDLGPTTHVIQYRRLVAAYPIHATDPWNVPPFREDIGHVA
jgi:hypothetical protein